MKKIQCSLFVLCSWLVTDQNLSAQIVPDQTLPQPSIVNQDIITGGTASGTTLFHSFRSFSIPTGSTAQFFPSAGVQNIITRVTGTERSLIDGLLAVNGTTNFFLLNPNGITFGQNAQLGINGSFFASTAQSLKFSDGSEFSAKSPQPPLLTISTPIGLQFGTRPASIEQTGSRLFVPPGQTLALLGGDVRVNGGSLIANSGKILLMTVDRPEFVRLSEPSNLRLGNLEISNQAELNTSGIGGGRVEIDAGNVLLSNARILSATVGDQNGQGISIRSRQFRLQDGAQIASVTTGSGKGGDIDISATDSFVLRGLDLALYQTQIGSFAQTGTIDLNTAISAISNSTFGTGQGGNISIAAHQIRLENGIGIGGATTQSGQAGSLKLQAKEMNFSSGVLATSTLPGSTGAGGNLDIQTDRLTLQDGSVFATGTLGLGNAGNISLNVRDDLTFAGVSNGIRIFNSITSGSAGGDQTQAGNITVDAGRLTIAGGGGISTGAGGRLGQSYPGSSGGRGGALTVRARELIDLSGISNVLADGTQAPSFLLTESVTRSPGGNLSIKTPILRVRDGGSISASSSGFGRSGDLTIEADRIEVFGRNGRFVSRIEATAGNTETTDFSILPSRIADSGNLTLNVRNLFVGQDGIITVENSGAGRAGNLTVNANQIRLEDRAALNARTGAISGGNINLRSQLMVMRRGSNIQSDANLTNGGNIHIETGILLAVLSENSNITATAISGRGGNINITAQGIFGFQQSRIDTAQSDINAASSTTALDGQVILKTFGSEPNLTSKLPSGVVNQAVQIAPTCARFAKTSQFVITERGGLAPSISEVVQSTLIWQDERGGKAIEDGIEPTAIAEATHWIQQSDGTIALVADTSHHQTAVDCPVGEAK